MPDFFKRLPEGAGKTVNKKQLQDFIKEIIFERSLADVKDIMETDCAGLPGASLAVMRTVNEAVNSGDFSRLKPLLDYAFEREVKVKK